MSWSIAFTGSVPAAVEFLTSDFKTDNKQGLLVRDLLLQELNDTKSQAAYYYNANPSLSFERMVKIEANGHSDPQSGAGAFTLKVEHLSIGTLITPPKYDELPIPTSTTTTEGNQQ